MDKRSVKTRTNSATYFFVALIAIYLIIELAATFTGWMSGMSITVSLCLSQGMILVPSIAYLIITRCSLKKTVRYTGTHWSFVLLVPVFVIALEPCMSLINALSLVWVDSMTTELSTNLIANNPLWLSTLLMAVTPAVVEELAYRGIILGEYRCAGRLKAIVMSGVLFGLMHMNFNQMAYAVFLGIMMGLLAEATGSIFTTMFAHFCFNEISVLLSYVVWNFSPLTNMVSDALESEMTSEQLLMTAVSLIPSAAVGLAVSLGVVFALASLNKRRDEFTDMFRRAPQKEGERVRIVRLPLIIAMCVCVGFMILVELAL